MASSKLTKADKQKIITLYCQSDETTSTLSERYGVSVSTISRLLKNQLAAGEYEELVRKKRAAGNRNSAAGLTKAPSELEAPEPAPAIAEPSEPVEAPATRSKTTRRRTRKTSSVQTEAQLELIQQPESTPEAVDPPALRPEVKPPSPSTPPAAAAVEFLYDEDEVEDEEDEDTDFGDDDLEDEYAEDDYEAETFEDDEEDENNLPVLAPKTDVVLTIHALQQARFPRTCYVVIDRLSELVTCPLQTFRDLGQIPESEASQRTLPLFDNHRVARRFSRRHQRVIKIPDSRLLEKTTPWLQAKGITRILMSGEVYALDATTADS